MDNDEAIALEENLPCKNGFLEKINNYLCTVTPKAAYFLLFNTMLISFYAEGLRSVTIIYVKEELGLTTATAKYAYHLSRFADIVFTIMGAILADMVIGKFLLILPVDIITIMIGLLLVLSSYEPFGFTQNDKINIAIVCLFLSKVVGIMMSSRWAFPGDQYELSQTSARDQLYVALYFMYSVGGISATIIVPRLRADVHCNKHSENCFLAAFGVPVLVSVFALLILVGGYSFYTFLPPAKETNWKLIKCFSVSENSYFIFGSTKIMMNYKDNAVCSPNQVHWIDVAADKYDADVISDVKAVWHLVVLYTAYPMFWALYYQQSSTWIIMASKMNGRTVFGNILPDQMNFLSPLLVSIGVIFFTLVLYPVFERIRFLRTPLERMGYGFALGVLCYAYGGCLNFAIEMQMPANPRPHLTDIAFHNGLPCNVSIQLGTHAFSIPKYTSIQRRMKSPNSNRLLGNLTKEGKCELLDFPDLNFTLRANGGSAYSVVFAMDRNNENITFQQGQQNRSRDNQKNAPKIRFIYVGKSTSGRAIALKSAAIIFCFPLSDILNDSYEAYRSGNAVNDETEICYYNRQLRTRTMDCSCDYAIAKYVFLRGGIYDMMIIENDDAEPIVSILATSKPDSVSILLQVPMYIMMAMGEVLASITGYSFAYSESPISTKTLLQSVNYINTSLGNLIVFLVNVVLNSIGSATHPDDPNYEMRASIEFFVYAILMGLDTVYFVYLADGYVYVNPVYRSIR